MLPSNIAFTVFVSLLFCLANLATANSTCESLECPKEYQVLHNNSSCPECSPPNCGGFAGTLCPETQDCFYPLGWSGGYCVTANNNKTGQTSPDQCVMCPQVMPDCAVVKCGNGEECVVEPQTCETCAQAKCAKKKSCVICNKMMPICDCAPGQECIQHPMTCDKCQWAECK